MIPLLALACTTPSIETSTEVVTTTALDLWADHDTHGDVVVLDEVLVSSPRTQDRERFYVQDPEGGPRSGLRVVVRGSMPQLPPPIGTPIRLAGVVDWSGSGPALELFGLADVEVLGPVAPLQVVPWADDPELVFALVEITGLQVTSAPDPLGKADTDSGPGLGGCFGVEPPGWGTQGDLTGILTSASRLSPRTPADWTGPVAGDPPLSTTLAAIRAGDHPDGTPVTVEDVVQATPWSRGSRWVVVQDAEGDGLWVDAEAWGVVGSDEGDALRWTGEVRTDGEGLRLRTWWDPVVLGSAPVQLQHGMVDGALVERSLSGVSGPDGSGCWTSTEGVDLCDRFMELGGLSSEVVIRGPVRADATAGLRIHPTVIDDRR